MSMTKHQLIHHELKARITRGDLAPGAPLPTQHELMVTYGVAQGTVRQALDRLAADGLVVAQRGKGTFVADPALRTAIATPVKTKSIGLVAVGRYERMTIVHDSLPRMQQVIEKESFEPIIRFFEPDTPEQTIVKWCSDKAGVILWSAAHMSLLNRLISLGIPTTMLGELIEGPVPPGASWVHFNIDDLASIAISLMLGMGHKHVWLVSRRGTYYYDWLARAFEEQARLQGLSPQSKIIDIPTIEDEPTLLDTLRNASTRPTALLIEGDMRACRLIHLLEQADMRVPDKISVMAIGANSPERLGVRDLFRVITPPDLSVDISVAALTEQIRTGRAVRHIIAPRFTPGKSCIRVPESA